MSRVKKKITAEVEKGWEVNHMVGYRIKEGPMWAVALWEGDNLHPFETFMNCHP